MKCICGFESRKILPPLTPQELQNLGNYEFKFEENGWTLFSVPCQITKVGEVMGIVELYRCPKCGTIRIE